MKNEDTYQSEGTENKIEWSDRTRNYTLNASSSGERS